MKYRILSATLMAALFMPLFAVPHESLAQVNPTKKNNAPVIRAVSTPTEVIVDQTGTWIVTASDPENDNLTYAVEWGDAALVTSLAGSEAGFVQTTSFSHTYTATGTYAAAFMAKDGAGAISSSTVTVHVNYEQSNPIIITGARAILPQFSLKAPPATTTHPNITSTYGPASLAVAEEGMWTLTASDPKNADLAYSVDWGDADNFLTKTLSKIMPKYVQSSTFTHAYGEAGTFTITSKVRNQSGYTDEATSSVTVTEPTDSISTSTVISNESVPEVNN